MIEASVLHIGSLALRDHAFALTTGVNSVELGGEGTRQGLSLEVGRCIAALWPCLRGEPQARADTEGNESWEPVPDVEFLITIACAVRS